jgi:hypothetical protein
VQSVASSVAMVPAGHWLQTDAPVLVAMLPMGQLMQPRLLLLL